MRYCAADKLEIIRLVETSSQPTRRTLETLGIPRATFYRWYDKLQTGGPCQRFCTGQGCYRTTAHLTSLLISPNIWKAKACNTFAENLTILRHKARSSGGTNPSRTVCFWRTITCLGNWKTKSAPSSSITIIAAITRA